MTLQLLLSEFPYIWEKSDFLFYQWCSFSQRAGGACGKGGMGRDGAMGGMGREGGGAGGGVICIMYTWHQLLPSSIPKTILQARNDYPPS